MRTLALLRGINVGGHNKLPMKDLRALCADLGFADVATYIQSGNVAFGNAGSDPAQRLKDGIHERFGLSIPVVLRTRSGLQANVDANPLPPDDKLLHLLFCDRPVDVSTLDANRSPGDVFRGVGDTIYVRYGTASHKSKLTIAWFEKQLGCTCTARNWRTARRLLAL